MTSSFRQILMTPGARAALMVALALSMALAGCDKGTPAPGGAAAPQATPDKAADKVADKAPVADAGAVADKAPAAALPELEYLEAFSGKADPAQGRLPMIVMMHGLGDQPESMRGLMVPLAVPARLILPRAPDRFGGGWSWFPLSKPSIDEPGPETLAGMERSADAVAAMIRKLMAERPTEGKPIVSGFSQGGMLAYLMAVRHPDLVQLSIPVAGWLPGELMPTGDAKLTGVPPIRGLHGDADERVVLAPTQATIEALKARGVDASLSVYPGVGHSFNRSMQVEFFNLIRTTLQPDESPQ